MRVLDLKNRKTVTGSLLICLALVFVSAPSLMAQKNSGASKLYVVKGVTITKIDDVPKEVKSGKTVTLSPGKHKITTNVFFKLVNEGTGMYLASENEIEFEFKAGKSYQIESIGTADMMGNPNIQRPAPPEISERKK